MPKDKKISKKERISMVKKAIEKKKAIDLYYRGQLSLEDLNAFGIKSALPL